MTSQAPAPHPDPQCSGCGAKLEPTDKFCMTCGTANPGAVSALDNMGQSMSALLSFISPKSAEEAEAKARREAEEQARREAEEQARREAEEQVSVQAKGQAQVQQQRQLQGAFRRLWHIGPRVVD